MSNSITGDYSPAVFAGYAASSDFSSQETSSADIQSASAASASIQPAESFDADSITLSEAAQAASDSSEADSSDGEDLVRGCISFAQPTPQYEKNVTLPDGESVIQLGDVDSSKQYFHKQGDNDLNFQGDCGLASCGDIANQFGVNVSENDVVHYAVDHGLCSTSGSPQQEGATTMADMVKVLNGIGVPAHLETKNSLAGVGRELEDGHSVIIGVNAGELWNNPKFDAAGGYNHAISLTGVALDPSSGEVKGVWIDDSGTGNFQEYVPADNPAIEDWSKSSIAVVTNGEHEVSSSNASSGEPLMNSDS
jgi:hypothetical protein